MKSRKTINLIAKKVMGWHIFRHTLPIYSYDHWNDSNGMNTGYRVFETDNQLLFPIFDPFKNVSHAIEVLYKLNKDGGCYSLINDDFGHWACVSDGMQPCEEKFEGSTTFFIDDKNLWANTIEGAICKAAIETTKE